MTKERRGEREKEERGEGERRSVGKQTENGKSQNNFCSLSLDLKLPQNKKPKTYVRNDNGDIVPL